MYQEIDVSEMKGLVKAGARLVDVREDEEVAAGMIQGALHMPLSDFINFKDQIASSGDIVFYCRSGKRSLKACELASQWTSAKLYSMMGGYLAYSNE